MFQNLMSYVIGLPESSYTLLADGVVDFDCNHIFTRLVSYGAIIMIYERYLFDEIGSALERPLPVGIVGGVRDHVVPGARDERLEVAGGVILVAGAGVVQKGYEQGRPPSTT